VTLLPYATKIVQTCQEKYQNHPKKPKNASDFSTDPLHDVNVESELVLLRIHIKTNILDISSSSEWFYSSKRTTSRQIKDEYQMKIT
jgi:hypothetical protein